MRDKSSTYSKDDVAHAFLRAVSPFLATWAGLEETCGCSASAAQCLFRLARPSQSGGLFERLTLSNRRGTGPVCTVVWQGSAGDRRPYADQTG